MAINRKLALGLLSVVIVALSACQQNPDADSKGAVQLPDQISEVQATDEITETAQVETKTGTDNTDRLLMMGVEDPQELKNFLKDLREYGETNNRDAMADLIQYPLNTYKAGQVTDTYTTKSEFLAAYETLVTPNVLEALSSANDETLFINQDGGSIKDGTVWINRFDDELRIYRING